MTYIKNPKTIEDRSFEIIQEIIEENYPYYSFNNEIEESIIKRAIHTSADFDYLHNLVFKENAITRIRETIRNGGKIFTDTNMALSGINKRLLQQMGCEYNCYVSDERAAAIAHEKGITRSMAAIELAAQQEGAKIFVLGNAPTAIYKILEMVKSGELDVEAVIGVPVGFVGAAESKEDLLNSEIPAIVARGRKGGSNVAAAIVNAILYTM